MEKFYCFLDEIQQGIDFGATRSIVLALFVIGLTWRLIILIRRRRKKNKEQKL
ncbi:MAG TPA: hypothetical protein VI112_09110 [Bacteroidia bacterium]|jgi:hypothetical protein